MSYIEQLRAEGYAVVEGVLGDEAVQRYAELLSAVPNDLGFERSQFFES